MEEIKHPEEEKQGQGERELIQILKKKIRIVWHDPDIHSFINLSFLAQIEDAGFLRENIVLCDSVDACVEEVKNNVHKIDILITSGINGEALFQQMYAIPKFLGFFQAVVFSQNVEQHKQWTQKYKTIKKMCSDGFEIAEFLNYYAKMKQRGRYVAFSDDFVFPFQIDGKKFLDKIIDIIINLKTDEKIFQNNQDIVSFILMSILLFSE